MDPIQSDALRIDHDQGAVEIVVYHRAILLFFTDSEAVRQIHEVCCRVDDLAPVAVSREAPGCSNAWLGSSCDAHRMLGE